MAEAAPDCEEPRRRSAARGGASRRSVNDAVPGMPIFVRPRHFVRGAGVYSVPLWDLTSRWLPEELKSAVPSRLGAAAAAATAAVPSGASPREGAPAGPGAYPSADSPEPPRAPQTDSGVEATQGRGDAAGEEGKAAAGEETPSEQGDDDDDNAGSDSELSEIGWEGPLGHESRVWSRAAVDGALMLLRRVAAPAGDGDGAEASPGYGLAVSSALFPPTAHLEGADGPLDRRLAEVLRLREPTWAVCALRSGHFAGAVFKGQEPLVHKTIHRYTVRAKAGGSQSAQDNTGKKVKSAGSSLRRYGEQRLREEIKELLVDKWSKEFAACEMVFVSVSKRMRSTLLGTEKEPFLPGAKIRKLPFMVGKPTYEAVRDAYLRVASVIFTEEKCIDALTARFKPVPAVKELTEEEQAAAAEAQAAARASAKAKAQEEEVRAKPYCEEDDEFYTPLHAAAASGKEDSIHAALDAGGDPCARDGKGRVPYFLCATVKAREAFRRWRGANEDAFDWQAALVPEGITDETERLKKEKEKEKKKKAKEKQKTNKAVQREEEEAQRRKEEAEAKALAEAQAKCDNCGKPLTSKPFGRLDYLYCTPDCVNAHRRTLQAEAAMKRLGGGA